MPKVPSAVSTLMKSPMVTQGSNSSVAEQGHPRPLCPACAPSPSMSCPYLKVTTSNLSTQH
ncbi:hypothetical protein A6R68_16717, partial [Neotoma lepida]